MIVVIPNGRALADDRATGNNFAPERAEGFARFERDLLDHLIPAIEKKYAFSSAPNTRPPAELVPDPAAVKAKVKLLDLWPSCRYRSVSATIVAAGVGAAIGNPLALSGGSICATIVALGVGAAIGGAFALGAHPGLRLGQERPQLGEQVRRRRAFGVEELDPPQPVEHCLCFLHGDGR